MFKKDLQMKTDEPPSRFLAGTTSSAKQTGGTDRERLVLQALCCDTKTIFCISPYA